MKIRTSEVFGPTIQGEGNRTGVMTVFVRFFGCNLSCDGFMQKDPTDPSTYVLPYQTIDISSIKKMEDLPVFAYGCDSGYSWSSKFKHLATDWTVEQVVEKIIACLPTYDGEPYWEHPVTGNQVDLCFTGGEPMMHQKAMSAIIEALGCFKWGNPMSPQVIQIETNGTKSVIDSFQATIDSLDMNGITTHFNISPKLYNVSGEKPEKAWKPEVIRDLAVSSGAGCLKFVVNGTDDCWDELQANIDELNLSSDYYPAFPIYVMPVGGTKEQQEDQAIVGKIATDAINRGYHVSGRLHAILFGNTMCS